MKKILPYGFILLPALLLGQCDSVDFGGEAPEVKDTTTYVCSGKTQCGEMKSCSEATYYLKNCPGVEIDGDGDGIPCEAQWCGR